MEFEVRLPYPEKIINSIKRIVKDSDDKQKAEERIKKRKQKNYNLFMKKNPFIENLVKIFSYLMLLGCVCVFIYAFGEDFLPEKIKEFIKPFMGTILYIGSIGLLFPIFFIALVDMLAARFKNKKLLSFKKRNKSK